jgi:hypothetical protein
MLVLDPCQGHRCANDVLWRYTLDVDRGIDMAKPFPISPKHPERICWGCDRYCPASSLACGNGSDRTMHPAEMIGDDWYLHGDWGIDPLIAVVQIAEDPKPQG